MALPMKGFMGMGNGCAGELLMVRASVVFPVRTYKKFTPGMAGGECPFIE